MGLTTKQEIHRPGVFKQTNKAHKTGRHRSKGSIGNEVKGRASVKVISKQIRKSLTRDARRHQSVQLRKKKREEVLAQKRNLGGARSAPVLLCVIPLREDFESTENVTTKLRSADDDINVRKSPCGIVHISVPRLKQRFSIVVPPVGNVLATLDAAKVANTVLFVASAIDATTPGDTVREEILDEWGKEILTSCLAQGLPAATVVLVDSDELNPKKRQEYKKLVTQTMSKWLPEEKVCRLDTPVDALNVLRRAGSQKQRIVTYKEKRPYLLAEAIEFASKDDSVDLGTLTVAGYLQGSPLSVNGLVHISGMGDFQMSEIDAAEDPFPIERNDSRIRPGSEEVNAENGASVRVLERADPNRQESLESENIPDPMDAEQTWPSKEELAQAAAARKKKIVKVVPKGMSEYQAAWIPDEDAESLSGCSDDGDDDDDFMSVDGSRSQADSEADNVESDDEEYETITISEAAPDESKYDRDIDMAEEKEAMEKMREARLDAQFPDEVDTPRDTLAKIRFEKYRGLESFRTSPWDPKENLPQDYARIFQFENFDRTRKRIFKESRESDGVTPGRYIRIHVADVKRDLFRGFCALENRPLIVFGLLPNERKMSLLNVVLKHANGHGRAIKSKERLVFQCGFRRFSACPIYSQHSNGSKHKYERYFHPEATVVASMYAPITFPPCPVLCYAEGRTGSLELVATGNILSANPDRIVAKRVVLSGHPFKVHKRTAVVRFMFFHREDIDWFKPVQLRTKYGRRGHIKEPLGTHGHMKCVFNGQLKSQDTILMNLYKRVFPKWTYEPYLLIGTSEEEEREEDAAMNVDP